MHPHPLLDPLGHGARSHLRHRFEQNLVASRNGGMLPPAEVHDDESTRAALGALLIRRRNTLGTARAAYATLTKGGEAMASFDDLLAEGRLRVRGNRVSVSMALLEEGRARTPQAMVLRELSVTLSTTRRTLPAALGRTSVGAAVRGNGLRMPRIDTRSPAWVAARLWEDCAAIKNPVHRLAHWEERWVILGAPGFVPSEVWTDVDVEAFVDAAFRTFNEPRALLEWSMVAGDGRLLRPAPFHRQHPGAGTSCSLVDAYLAMGPGGDGVFLLGPLSPVHGLVRILLTEVEGTVNAPFPHPLMRRLATLAQRHPEILACVLEATTRQPRLYADLLGTDLGAAAAAHMAGSHRTPFPSIDTITRHDAMLGGVAVGDAVGALAAGLLANDASDTRVVEFAALIAHAFDRAAHGTRAAPLLLERMRPLLHTLPGDLCKTLIAILVGVMGDLSHHTGAFVAALDLAGPDMAVEAPIREALVARYVAAIGGTFNAPSLQALDARPAAALVRLARLGAPRSWRAFCDAAAVSARLSGTKARSTPAASRRYDAARALREHIRVLCRGAVGWSGDVPEDLATALASAIRKGSRDDRTKRTVDAFAVDVGQPMLAPSEPAIAEDLASALNRTRGSSHDLLLDALCGIPEPAVVSAIETLVPEEWRPRLAQRTAELTSSAASPMHTFTAMLARARELVNAGHHESAIAIFDNVDEQRLARLPNGPTALLYLRLDIAYRQGRHDAVLEWTLRDGASQPEQDALAHFKGLVFLSRRDGARAAEAIYQALVNRRSDVSGYEVNLLAARLSRFLQDNLFGRIDGADRDDAKTVLAGTTATYEATDAWPPEQRNAFLFNRALLMLGLDDPTGCLATLADVGGKAEPERVSAYGAVALHRLGKSTDAIEQLRILHASGIAGELTTAALAHITHGRPFAGVAGFIDVAEAGVYRGLAGFRALPPGSQLRAWHGGMRSDEEVIVADVRACGTQMSELSPLLRDPPSTQKGLRKQENDLTSLLRSLLVPRAQFFGWMWNEQSPGGITAKGNPGKRDLALMHGDSVHAVIEAVICQKAPTTKFMRGELLNHLQRLFGYADCSPLFLVVYSYRPDPEDVRDILATTAAGKDILPGLRLEDTSQLPVNGTLVPGFVAHYRLRQRAVNVYFLVIDVRKGLAHQIGAAAAVSNPRTP